MASGSFWQVHVRCPFYKKDDGHSHIWCEGLLPGASDLRSYFPVKADFNAQIEHCCKDYRNCKVFQELIRKYNADEKEKP